MLLIHSNYRHACNLYFSAEFHSRIHNFLNFFGRTLFDKRMRHQQFSFFSEIFLFLPQCLFTHVLLLKTSHTRRFPKQKQKANKKINFNSCQWTYSIRKPITQLPISRRKAFLLMYLTAGVPRICRGFLLLVSIPPAICLNIKKLKTIRTFTAGW